MGEVFPLSISTRDHILGAATAELTVVLYSDFTNPACAATYAKVRRFQDESDDTVRLVVRHFPLEYTHPHAFRVAEAAEAAAAQDKFWQFQEYCYDNQHALTDGDLLEYALALQLDTHQFLRDLSSHAFIRRVQEDFWGGIRSGVRTAPAVFMARSGSPVFDQCLPASLLSAQAYLGSTRSRRST